VGRRSRGLEALLMETIDSQTLSRLMEQLPEEHREVQLLREVEGLSYKQMATVSRTPIGTVMSRLSRARLELRRLWLQQAETETSDGVGAARNRPRAGHAGTPSPGAPCRGLCHVRR
jgi:RNA polymerase sigma-70 factor (ECF subfamily)